MALRKCVQTIDLYRILKSSSGQHQVAKTTTLRRLWLVWLFKPASGQLNRVRLQWWSSDKANNLVIIYLASTAVIYLLRLMCTVSPSSGYNGPPHGERHPKDTAALQRRGLTPPPLPFLPLLSSHLPPAAPPFARTLTFSSHENTFTFCGPSHS